MTAIQPRPGRRTRTRIWSYRGTRQRRRVDTLATEEPLEIRVVAPGPTRSGSTTTAAVTMRTPGADFELAAGFLRAEGVVDDADDIAAITYCVDPEVDVDQRYNIVNVTVAGGLTDELVPLERHFLTTSACGVCGKATLEALEMRGVDAVSSEVSIDRETLTHLPDRMRDAQKVFDRTGGLHAAGLFTADGQLLQLREDVGRHNALDKLLGWALLDGRLPLDAGIVLVSGRASYELVQKCAVAGVPVLCAISAPSSLAVDVAQRFGVTLVGFLRGDRFNVYSAVGRIVDNGRSTP